MHSKIEVPEVRKYSKCQSHVPDQERYDRQTPRMHACTAKLRCLKYANTANAKAMYLIKNDMIGRRRASVLPRMWIEAHFDQLFLARAQY
jgi:hypothetical protein